MFARPMSRLATSPVAAHRDPHFKLLRVENAGNKLHKDIPKLGQPSFLVVPFWRIVFKVGVRLMRRSCTNQLLIVRSAYNKVIGLCIRPSYI